MRWPVTTRERFGSAWFQARAGLDAARAFDAPRAPVTAPAFRHLSRQAPRRSRGLLGSPVAWTPRLRSAEFRAWRLVPRRTFGERGFHGFTEPGGWAFRAFHRVSESQRFGLAGFHPSRPAGGFGRWWSGRLPQPPQRLTRRCSELLRASRWLLQTIPPPSPILPPPPCRSQRAALRSR